jgi:hypothetical protein
MQRRLYYLLPVNSRQHQPPLPLQILHPRPLLEGHCLNLPLGPLLLLQVYYPRHLSKPSLKGHYLNLPRVLMQGRLSCFLPVNCYRLSPPRPLLPLQIHYPRPLLKGRCLDFPLVLMQRLLTWLLPVKRSPPLLPLQIHHLKPMLKGRYLNLSRVLMQRRLFYFLLVNRRQHPPPLVPLQSQHQIHQHLRLRSLPQYGNKRYLIIRLQLGVMQWV